MYGKTQFRPARSEVPQQLTPKRLLEDIPSELDWRTKGAVTPVKDQGNCGSCWIFSAVGVIEGINAISTGELKAFSEQQILDCYKWPPFADGCNGGHEYLAMQYVMSNGGIMLEDDYPYIAMDPPDHCTFDESKAVGTVSAVNGVYEAGRTDWRDQMKQAIAQGPVTVTLDASKDAFMNYGSGIISYAECDFDDEDDDINHALVAVGYGSENGMDYWIVKNSWTADWGEDGFVRLEQGIQDPQANNDNPYAGACGVGYEPWKATV